VNKVVALKADQHLYRVLLCLQWVVTKSYKTFKRLRIKEFCNTYSVYDTESIDIKNIWIDI